ncbi:putative pre-16S rRNA nuclease [Dirofilaria immitis]
MAEFEKDEEEPLRATYTPSRPPWIGYWNKRWDQRDQSKSRKVWWTELGWTDAATENGKMVIARPQLREHDPEYYDPKVPDGTSLAGPMGLDSTRYPNLTRKGDQPGNYEKFMNKLYKTSTQYKDIASKYELTEGPWPHYQGLKVMRANNNYHEFLARHKTSWWIPKPFRFFNSPLNEDPIIKGLACAQYTAFFLIPYTGLHIRGHNILPVPVTPLSVLKTYFKLLPTPATLAFAWGVTLSGAAMVRHKDDFMNHLYASAATGIVFATMRDNFLAGFSLGFVVYITGLCWQYMRVSEWSLQNKVIHRKSGSFYGGPLVWKLKWRGGEEEIPTKKW